MSTHGRAASAPGARLPWQDARFQSPALLRFVKAAMAAALALCLVQPTSAQQQRDVSVIRYTGTLKKINDSGEIRIGYRENSPPFAFLDAQRKPLGYSLDPCEIVVEEIAAELGKDIRVVRRPVTPAATPPVPTGSASSSRTRSGPPSEALCRCSRSRCAATG